MFRLYTVEPGLNSENCRTGKICKSKYVFAFKLMEVRLNNSSQILLPPQKNGKKMKKTTRTTKFYL